MEVTSAQTEGFILAKIIEVLGWENKGSYAKVHVLLDDGLEAYVWVGGEVEVFMDKSQTKAFVKRRKS